MGCYRTQYRYALALSKRKENPARFRSLLDQFSHFTHCCIAKGSYFLAMLPNWGYLAQFRHMLVLDGPPVLDNAGMHVDGTKETRVSTSFLAMRRIICCQRELRGSAPPEAVGRLCFPAPRVAIQHPGSSSPPSLLRGGFEQLDVDCLLQQQLLGGVLAWSTTVVSSLCLGDSSPMHALQAPTSPVPPSDRHSGAPSFWFQVSYFGIG